MKKFLLAALLITGMSTFAQEITKAGLNQPRREKITVETKVKKLTDDLSLDEKQQLKVTALLTEQDKKRAEIIEKGKAAGTDMTTRTALRNEMKEQSATLKVKMKEILTAEQYTKWEASTKSKRDLSTSLKTKEGMQIKNTDKTVVTPSN